MTAITCLPLNADEPIRGYRKDHLMIDDGNFKSRPPLDLDKIAAMIGREFKPYEKAIILGMLDGNRTLITNVERAGKTRLINEAVRVLRGYNVDIVIVDEYPLDTPVEPLHSDLP